MAKSTAQNGGVKRALSAHSALGIAIAAVLYIICLSGTLSVFRAEFNALERRDAPVVTEISPAAVQRAAQAGLAAEPDSAHLYVSLPLPREHRVIVHTDNKEFYADAEGNLAGDVALPWGEFLINLHYYLHLPKSFGMTIVAIFGVMLFAMSITGLLAHPKIFKDAFAFRRSSEQIRQVDLHNRLAVWTAPFHISNSLSGAMIGLATLSALFIGQLNYGGDSAAVFGPVFGEEPGINMETAPLAPIDEALRHVSETYPDRPAILAILHDPATQGQYLQIMARHMDRLIYAEKYNYNGAGEFVGTVGSADGHIGQQVADSVYRVHFGYFGGLPVKLAFGVFGLCLLTIIHAGLRIYFIKSRREGSNLSAWAGAWNGLVFGAPGLLAFSFAYAMFMPVTTIGLTRFFWAGLMAVCLAGAILSRRRTDQNRLS